MFPPFTVEMLTENSVPPSENSPRQQKSSALARRRWGEGGEEEEGGEESWCEVKVTTWLLAETLKV